METIYDILREMRGIRPDCDDCISNHTCEYLYRFSDRIEKSAKWRDQYIEKLTNENASLRAELNKDDCLKLANDVDRLRAENERLRAALQPVLKLDNDVDPLHAENARLKAALQPVLDCDVTKESYLAQSEVVWIAQRIWKEGEK